MAKFSQAAEEYFASVREPDDLFLQLYPEISLDRHGFQPPEYGTQEHILGTFLWAQDIKLWTNKDIEVRNNRWFQTPNRWLRFREHKGTLKLVIIYVGLHFKWWEDVKLSPLYVVEPMEDIDGAGDSDSDDDDGADGGDGGHETAEVQAQPRAQPSAGGAPALHAPPDRVQGGDRQEDMKINAKNAIYLVGNILGRGLTPTYASLIAEWIKPVMKAHGDSIKEHKDPTDCLAWHIEMSTGERMAYITQMV